MNIAHKPMAHRSNETPKQRLVRVTESGPPFRAGSSGPWYLLIVGLLVLLLAVVAIGIIGGTLGYDVVYEHARQIAQWARGMSR